MNIPNTILFKEYKRALRTLGMLIFLLVISLSTKVEAQQLPAPISQKLEVLQSNHQHEQKFDIWFQTDQPYYLPGDTMTLDVYVYSRTEKTTRFNGQVWVDVVSRQNEIKKHLLLKVTAGKATTRIALSNLMPDYYLLAAYTNDLARLGSEYFSKQPLLIMEPWGEAEGAGENLLQSRQGEQTDLQMRPVSGQLIAGVETDLYLRTRKGYKTPVAESGTLHDNEGTRIASWSTDASGLGRVRFTPAAEQSYYLRPDSTSTISADSIPLRAVAPQGIAMLIDNLIGKGVKIQILSSAEYKATDDLYLVVQAAGMLVHSHKIDPGNPDQSVLIPNSEFPLSVAQALIMEAGGKVISQQYFYPSEPVMLTVKPILEGGNTTSPRNVIQVEAALKTITGQALPGNVTVSVWDKGQLDPLAAGPTILAAHYLREQENQGGAVVSSAGTLQKKVVMSGRALYDWTKNEQAQKVNPIPPDQRLYIRGRAVDTDDQSPITDAKIAFLLLKERYTFIATTDDQGRFIVEVPRIGANEEAIYRVFKGTKDFPNAEVTLEGSKPAYEVTLPDPLTRYTAAQQEYRRKSVMRQEFFTSYTNYYAEEKEEERDYRKLDLPKPDFSVNPEDYVVMQSMEEVFREIVPGVFLRKRNDGYRLRIFSPEKRVSFENEPLILIDAQPVTSLEAMLSLDPANIDRVDTYNYLTSMSQFGPLGSNGVLSIITKNGSFQPKPEDQTRLLTISGYANAEKPETNEIADPNMPSLNPLVYWKSHVRIDSNGYLTFSYTQNDALSEFIIRIQGYTDTGDPIYFEQVYKTAPSP